MNIRFVGSAMAQLYIESFAVCGCNQGYRSKQYDVLIRLKIDAVGY